MTTIVIIVIQTTNDEYIMTTHSERAKQIISESTKAGELFTAIVSDLSEDLLISRYNNERGYRTVKLEAELVEYLGDTYFLEIDGSEYKYALILDEDGNIK